MNIDTLYLKLETKAPFQVISNENEVIIFENRNKPFSLYSKHYISSISELVQDEKKTISIDYLTGSNPDNMQILVLKDVHPCLGTFTKIKNLSLERLQMIRMYYNQEVLNHPVLMTYPEFSMRIFFQKKISLDSILKSKQT